MNIKKLFTIACLIGIYAPEELTTNTTQLISDREALVLTLDILRSGRTTSVPYRTTSVPHNKELILALDVLRSGHTTSVPDHDLLSSDCDDSLMVLLLSCHNEFIQANKALIAAHNDCIDVYRALISSHTTSVPDHDVLRSGRDDSLLVRLLSYHNEFIKANKALIVVHNDCTDIYRALDPGLLISARDALIKGCAVLLVTRYALILANDALRQNSSAIISDNNTFNLCMNILRLTLDILISARDILIECRTDCIPGRPKGRFDAQYIKIGS